MERRPVANGGRQIARVWNTTDAQSGYAGFVTKFEIDAVTAQRYPGRIASGRSHEELCVPAESWSTTLIPAPFPAASLLTFRQSTAIVGMTGQHFGRLRLLIG